MDLIFLRQTEPARPAEWIRPPKVSLATGVNVTHSCVCVCVCVRALISDLNHFPSLQERNLHSGQWPGDLHRQGDGSEATTQRNQRRREARPANDAADPPVLDPLKLPFRPRPAVCHSRRRRVLLLHVAWSFACLYSSFFNDQL